MRMHQFAFGILPLHFLASYDFLHSLARNGAGGNLYARGRSTEDVGRAARALVAAAMEARR